MRFGKFQNVVSVFLLAGLKALAQPMEFNIEHLSNIDSSWQYALSPKLIVANSVAHVLTMARKIEHHGVYYYGYTCLVASNNSSGTFGPPNRVTDIYSETGGEGGGGFAVVTPFFPFLLRTGQLFTVFQRTIWTSLSGYRFWWTHYSLADTTGYVDTDINKTIGGSWLPIAAVNSANDTVHMIIQKPQYGSSIKEFKLLKAYAGEIVDSLRIAQSSFDLPPQMSLDQSNAVHYVWAIPESSSVAPTLAYLRIDPSGHSEADTIRFASQTIAGKLLRLFADDSGTAHILFVTSGNKIFYVSHGNAGFMEPASYQAGQIKALRFVVTKTGHRGIIWPQGDSLLFSQVRADVGISEPVLVRVAPNINLSDAAVSESNEAFAVAWRENVTAGSSHTRIVAATLGSDDSFDAQVVAESDTAVSAPVLKVDGSGELHLAWTDQRSNLIYYAGTTNGTFSEPVLVASETGRCTLYDMAFDNELERVYILYISGSAGRSVVGVASSSPQTAVKERVNEERMGFRLFQNYPNPFNPNTKIRFALRHPSFVTLKVYNILGEEIATLVTENLAAGKYEADWNARGHASGVYLYHLEAGECIETKKLTVLK